VVDGAVMFDETIGLPLGAGIVEAIMKPPQQLAVVDLVRAVAEANPRTVVVVNSGAPVLLPWADDVAAVLVSWFSGQEFGSALADVLTGVVEPGGRLPMSWPASAEGLPAAMPVNGELPYDEGLLIGNRWYLATDRATLIPFGHGLGYTSWSYEGMVVDGDTVTVSVRNAGDRPGREVTHLYASRLDSAVERAPRWLVGSAVVKAAAGERADAAITLADHNFRHWDSSAHAWTVEPGIYQLHSGRSVVDLPLQQRDLPRLSRTVPLRSLAETYVYAGSLRSAWVATRADRRQPT
jgi:beta-glucosidase